MKKNVMVLFGTRPEYIKLLPVIKALAARDDIQVTTVNTGQHQELLQRVMERLPWSIDHDLQVMTPNQSLDTLASHLIEKIGELLASVSPDHVIVQGDTTTAFCGALSAYHHQIPVSHVEAGLRTDSIYSPFPEEMNRRLISQIATLNFAPTERATKNLAASGVPGEVHTLGNTVVDAQLDIVKQFQAGTDQASSQVKKLVVPGKTVLVTTHRRENFGSDLDQICQAIVNLAQAKSELHFLLPVHKNPNVEKPVRDKLGDLSNVHLIDALDYFDLQYVLQNSCLVLTDSGGITEEAPTFGVPTLILRKTTERQEAVEAGFAFLMGTDDQAIFDKAMAVLDDSNLLKTLKQKANPFGDGKSGEGIAQILSEWKQA